MKATRKKKKQTKAVDPTTAALASMAKNLETIANVLKRFALTLPDVPTTEEKHAEETTTD